MTNKLTLTEQEELRQCEIRKARIMQMHLRLEVWMR